MDVSRAIAQAGGLVSLPDIARRMGVSRTRARQFVEMPGFPLPVASIGEGTRQAPVRVWLWREVQAWKARR